MGAMAADVDDPQFTRAADDLFAPDLLAPPLEWFTTFPNWIDQVPMRKCWIDSDGRAAARTFGPTCLIGADERECWIPTASPTNYEAFHQGAYPFLARTASAVSVSIEELGVVAGRTGHAPESLAWGPAQQWYANTEFGLMIGRAFDVREEDGVNGYFLGAVLPSATVNDVMMVRRVGMSCDWRYRVRDNNGRPLNQYDNLGPILVNRPGLPLGRRGQTAQVRYRPMAASIALPAGGEVPVGYYAEFDEGEPPMFCTHCGQPTSGPNVTPCGCSTAPHVAAMQPPPVQDPANAAPPAADNADLRAEVSELREQVSELTGMVAEMMVAGVSIADLADA